MERLLSESEDVQGHVWGIVVGFFAGIGAGLGGYEVGKAIGSAIRTPKAEAPDLTGIPVPPEEIP